jgi:hypothetical protein
MDKGFEKGKWEIDNKHIIQSPPKFIIDSLRLDLNEI